MSLSCDWWSVANIFVVLGRRLPSFRPFLAPNGREINRASSVYFATM